MKLMGWSDKPILILSLTLPMIHYFILAYQRIKSYIKSLETSRYMQIKSMVAISYNLTMPRENVGGGGSFVKVDINYHPRYKFT